MNLIPLLTPFISFSLNKIDTLIDRSKRDQWVSDNSNRDSHSYVPDRNWDLSIDLELCKRLIERLPTEMVLSNAERLLAIDSKDASINDKSLFLYCLDELKKRGEPSLHILNPELSSILKSKGFIS